MSLVFRFMKRAALALPLALGACSSENRTTEIAQETAYCVHVPFPKIFDSRFSGGVLPSNYMHDMSRFGTSHNFYIKKPGIAENSEGDETLLEARADAYKQPDAESGKFKILALGLTGFKREEGAPNATLEGYGPITLRTIFEADITKKTCTVSHPNSVFGKTNDHFIYHMK